MKIPYGTASRLAFILATLGGVWAGSLRAQSTVGLVDLSYVSIDQTYTANVYDNASQWGTPDLYVAAQTLSVSNLSSSTIDLQSSTLIAFCVEVGQDAPTSSTPYQIFDTGSMALTDSTAIPGTPGLQPAVSPFEASAMIDPMSGIGAYRATQLGLLYGYAFGSNGVLSSGYHPGSLSAADQVAFQLDVWKLSHEGTSAQPALAFQVPTGGISASGFSATGGIDSTVITEANALLAGVSADQGITPMALYDLNNGSTQDYLIPMGSFSEVPEPSDEAVLIALVVLAFVLRRGTNPAS